MRLCVFDLDHTLIRSPLDLAAMAIDMRVHLEERWRPLPARPERYRVGELIALCQAEAPHLEPDLWSIALDHERKAVGEASLEPGALEAVCGARAVGFHTALWTNNAREVTLHALTRFGLDALLDITVTRDEMRQLKPHPDGWRVIRETAMTPSPQSPNPPGGRHGSPGPFRALGVPGRVPRPPQPPTPPEGRHGFPGAPRALGVPGGVTRPPQPPTSPEGRHGFPGPFRALGVPGRVTRPPQPPTSPEGRHGFPGAPRALGGLGGHLEAPHSVVVGDSWVDGAAAGAAGVPFIAYRTNPRDLERWKVTPVAILTNLGDLPALLAKLRESG